VSSTINYVRQFFAHTDWIDFVDSIRASGANGMNARMHAIEQEFDSLSGVISQLNSGLGAFQPVGAAGAVAYSGGPVGVGGGFTSAAPPTSRIEANLGANSATSEQVRFGNVVCCNGGTGAFAGYAVVAHKSHASDTDYALRQGPNGDVQLNAASGRPISIRQNGSSVRLGVSAAGNVIIGAESDLPGGGTAILQVAGDAFKLTPGNNLWSVSDVRLKDNVRNFDVGLAALTKVRPVRFEYNGRAGTRPGQEGVGVVAQEIEKILPESVRKVPGVFDDDTGDDALRTFDSSPLTFVLVNAVKELAKRVEDLERALEQANAPRRRAAG
jgi:hypothetical protein